MEAFKPYIDRQAKRVKEGQIYCKARRKWVSAKSEELVRQGILEYLLEVVKIPRENLWVEESLRHWEIKNRGRMDIAITYTEFDEKEKKWCRPLMIIECKEGNVDIDTAVSQALGYQKEMGAHWLLVTNGQDTKRILDKKTAEKVISISSYEELLKGKGIKVKKIPQEQPLQHSVPFSAQVYKHYKKETIGDHLGNDEASHQKYSGLHPAPQKDERKYLNLSLKKPPACTEGFLKRGKFIYRRV